MENTIQVGERIYPVDVCRSGIRASVDHGSDLVTISIFAEPEEDSLDEYCHANVRVFFSLPWPLKNGWNSLSKFKAGPNSPLDIHAEIYLGWHENGTQCLVELSDYEDGGFNLTMECESRDQPGDSATQVSISSWIPVADIAVNYPHLFRQVCDSCDADDIEEMERRFRNLDLDENMSTDILAKSFEMSKYGKPTRLRWGLRFPFEQNAR